MKRDSIAVVFALVFHGALAFALSRAPKNPKPSSSWVEMEMRKKPPPPPVALPPTPKPEPEKPQPPKVAVKKAPKIVEPPKAPIPNQTPPKEPPREPPKPLFGVTAASTVGDSSFSVAVGNTTIADTKNVAKKGEVVQPLAPPPPGAAPAPVFKPASPLEIVSDPEFDESSCGMIPYPEGEAKQLEIEGETKLRVEIDDHGKVHGVRIIKGVGHGLDEMAVSWMKNRCRFPKPAFAKGGKAVASVITHTFTWQIDR